MPCLLYMKCIKKHSLVIISFKGRQEKDLATHSPDKKTNTVTNLQGSVYTVIISIYGNIRTCKFSSSYILEKSFVFN